MRDSIMSGSPDRLNRSINGNSPSAIPHSPREPVIPQTPVAIKEGLPDILTRRRYRNRQTFASMYSDPQAIKEENMKETIVQKSYNKNGYKNAPVEF
jgi:hypothetical protein